MMSQLEHSPSPPPARTRYWLYTREDQPREIALPVDRPLYMLVPDLVAEVQLPTAAGGIAADDKAGYALYGGPDRRRLSREQTLSQAGLTESTPLYLAQDRRPWWRTSDITPPAAPVPASQGRRLPRQLSAWLLAGGTGALLLLLLLLLLSPSDSPDAAEVAPWVSGSTGVPAAALATATLAPVEPTSTATTLAIATAPPTYVDTVEVQGVLPELRYTGRVTSDGRGTFTRMRAAPDASSERLGLLRNGDRLGVLDATVEGWYRVRRLTNQISASGGDEGWIERWLVTGVGAPAPPPTPLQEMRLRVVRSGEGGDKTCISTNVRGIATAGWFLRVDGLRLVAGFDSIGIARVCGLTAAQEVTVSVFRADGSRVPGGGGIPARGGDIFEAEWR